MGFYSALTAGQKAALRSEPNSAAIYAAFCPNAIVFQAQPSSAVVDAVYAAIDYTNVQQGAYTDVLEGMTYIISSGTTNYDRPLHIGRIRKDAVSGTLYVEENAFALQTGYYVTVLNDYRLWVRAQRVLADGTYYKDFDLTFEKLAPRIYNLSSSYVRIDDTSASVAFAPSVAAEASGATISTYSWAVDDGTITSGTSADKDITVSFPTGHRWVRLTATDSNGVSSFFAFEVYVVPTDLSSVVRLDVANVSISANVDTGREASFSIFGDDFDGTDLLAGNRVTLFVVPSWGSGDPAFNEIVFVGNIRNDSSSTSGSDVGVVREGALTASDYQAQTSEVNTPAIAFIRASSPAAWDEIASLTLDRALWHTITRHSTLANICAIAPFSSASDYERGTFTSASTTLNDAISAITGYYRALFVLSADGQAVVEINNQYLNVVDRAAQTTIIDDIAASDLISYDIVKQNPTAVSHAIAYGTTYDTTDDDVDVFEAAAPANATAGGTNTPILNSIILPSDEEADTSRLNLSTIAAAWYGLNNPLTVVDVTLPTGWYFLQPAVHQWYGFDISATNNVRGVSFTSSDQFLLKSMSIDFDAEQRTLTTSASFEKAVSLVNAQIGVSQLLSEQAYDLPALPYVMPYSSLDTAPSLNFPTDDLDPLDLPALTADDSSVTSPTNEPTSGTPQRPPNCWITTLFLTDNSIIGTPFNTVLNEPYTVTVVGSGFIGAQTWLQTFDLTAGTQSWSLAAGFAGSYVAGVGFRVTGSSASTPGVGIVRPVSAFTLTSASMRYTLVKGSTSSVSRNTLIYSLDATSGASTQRAIQSHTNSVTNATLSTGAINVTNVDGMRFQTAIGASGTGASATINQVTVGGVGTNPYGGSTTDKYGDAFYKYSDSAGTQNVEAYGSSQGLRIDNATPAVYPQYNANHLYTFQFTGTGNPMQIRFLDTDYSDNQNVPLTITVCGKNAGSA